MSVLRTGQQNINRISLRARTDNELVNLQVAHGVRGSCFLVGLQGYIG